MGESKGTRRVRDALAAHGVESEIREMPGSTRTAEDAAAAVGCAPAQIVKSLLFVTDAGEPVLALVSGANRADPARLAEAVGAPVALADPGTVREVTGFAIGGVAPVGLVRPVRVLLDRDLLAFDTVWAAAGKPTTVVELGSTALRRITDAQVVEVTGSA